ncbi:hypothetical protein V8J36_05320 [Frigidibacter sp. MR17.14]|uniref:head-tail joining protein n=1 Tax=Frigidibacter sp. MR17.14 TaxID=3126509 RepID=UPI003012B378
MTSPEARVVDATFTRLGLLGVLDPDGAAPRAVRVMPSQDDEIVPYSRAQVLTATDVFEIRASDFTGFGKGAALQVGDERFVVQVARARDKRRLVFVLDCRKAA